MTDQHPSGVYGTWHCGIAVTDIEVSLKFYRDALGLEVSTDRIANHDYLREVTAIPSAEVRIVYLKIPGSDFQIELLEHRGVERIPSRMRPCDPGSVHIGLYVTDVEEVAGRMASAGYPSRSGHPIELDAGPFKGGRSCFIHDPDGFLVELNQRPPAAV